MSQNRIQHGGDHYQKAYQHWDFVHDRKLDYFIGCATKYICREKWGVRRSQDLRKAIHYLRKRHELGYKRPYMMGSRAFRRFSEQFDEDVQDMLIACSMLSSDKAADYIETHILPKYAGTS